MELNNIPKAHICKPDEITEEGIEKIPGKFYIEWRDTYVKYGKPADCKYF